MTKVSIIVPVYNEEKHLNRCVDSVLCQTYSDLELLLVDDGSTDNSSAICDEYAQLDSRVRVFHKENGGVSKARNLGISKANAEWIMFLDSDDYLMKDALEILISLARNTKTLISTGNFYFENVERRIFCTGIRSGIISNNFRAWYFESICLRAGAALYHKSIIDDKMYNESLSRYEDASSVFNLLREYKVSYTNKFIMVYSMDDKGLSNKCKDKNKDFIFHLNFDNKSFWEKMLLGNLLNEGLSLYSEYKDELMIKYKAYIKYAVLDCKIRRLKKYKRKLYNFLSRL